MFRRSRAREVALQLLYQRDLNPHEGRTFIEQFAQARLSDPSMVAFCLSLYDGAITREAELAKRLSEAAENWRLTRMAVVDRNVLRLGTFELLEGKEPPLVAINEAIELARRFGSAGSPAFVNGVLDRIRKSLIAPANQPHAAP